MLSPVGSTADTRSLECEIVTCACGVKPGVAKSAEGFFGRSTMVAGIEQGGTSELCEGSVGASGFWGEDMLENEEMMRRGP
jgi:hypothetical protein